MGVTQVALTWSTDNGTESYRMLLGSIGSPTEMTNDSAVSISGLKPGFQHIILYLPESEEIQRDTLVMEGGRGASSTEGSPAVSTPWPSGRASSTYRLVPADPASSQESQGTEVLLVGLKPSAQYRATVYSQAADGTEGQPQAIEFRTNSSQVFDIQAMNISATSMTLTWKISSNGSSSAYTYKIQVTGEASSLSLTVSETHAVVSGLSSSTLYNITVWPFLGDAEGTPGFLQVYTYPSAVFGIRVVHVTTTEMRLEWQNTDGASAYVYHLVVQSESGSREVNSSEEAATLQGLIPGTLYNITISPEASQVWGQPSSIVQYTRPSSVANIVINTSTTAATLSWQNPDAASPTYSYRLLIEKAENSSNATQVVRTDVGVTNATVMELIPGSLYRVEIFTQVGNVTESLTPSWESFCTGEQPQVPVDPLLCGADLAGGPQVVLSAL
ncbi:Receptor-type tyrosine-protein phosphatase eta [Sciurus carolinensis]|uniref:Receptor-type tyrosine-protein phosphatase eta n=1 Tax=Sciurus carolinensis TaxID=30640 RepID=A0AA41T3Y4_SCICA|nr:Receptor-type tyrosine-protein phosphatase eta [Sciurus carolinensis]